MADDGDLPVIDPQIQAAVDRWRQQQLIAQLQGQQQNSGVPHNLGEGIASLGDGLANAVNNYRMRQQGQVQQDMAKALGNMPINDAPFPSYMGMGGGAGNVGSLGAVPSGGTVAGGLTPAQQEFADAWKAKGANPIAIAGIMGNVAQESRFNPTAKEVGGGGIGLYQHTGPRRTDLLANVPDLNPVGQTDYAASELGGPNAPGLSIAKLNTARTPTEAALMWEHGFERAGAPNMANRISKANQFANMLGGQTSPSGPGSYGVPPGLTAGPGVPSNLPPPIPAPRPVAPSLEGRSVAAAPPSPSPDEEDSPPQNQTAIAPQPMGPSPSAVNPMLSPTPMGAPQGFVPPPQTVQPPAAGAPPSPAAAPRPMSPVASAVPSPQQGIAPPGTHWAQLPGPPLLLRDNQDAATQGGGGQGLGGLLANLLGGGSAQAATATRAPTALARGLGGQPPASPAASVGAPATPTAPPQPSPSTAPTASADPRWASLNSQYTAAVQEHQKFQRAAYMTAGTPFAAPYQKQADEAFAEMQDLRKRANDMQNERPAETEGQGGGRILYDPRTGKTVAQVTPPKSPLQPVSPEVGEQFGLKDTSGFQYDPQTHKIEQITGTGGTTHPPTDEDIKNYPFLGDAGNRGMWAMNKDDTPKYVGPKPGEPGAADKNIVIGSGGELVNRNTGEVVHKNEPQTTLSDGAINQMAERANGGDNSVLVGLGRGAQGAENIAKIRNKMADMGSSQDQIDNTVELMGRKSTARTIGGIVGKLDIFGESAVNAGDLAIAKSNAMPRGSFVPWNQLVQYGKSQMSDPNVRDLYAANNTLINEYARATTPAGVPTDSQRAHADQLLRMADSPDTYKSVVHLLQWEIHNVQQSGQNVAGKLRKGAGGEEPGAPLALPGQEQGAPTAPSAAAPQKRFKYNSSTGLLE